MIPNSSCERDWSTPGAEFVSATHLLPYFYPRLPENLRDEVFATETKRIGRSRSLATLGWSVEFTGLEQRFTLSLPFTLKLLIDRE